MRQPYHFGSILNSFIHLLACCNTIANFFWFLNRPETEKLIAEKFGLGVMTGSTFTLKEHIRDDIQRMCLPKISQNKIKGIITHVG